MPTSCPSTGGPGDPLEPGLTPLIRADRLAERLGLGEVWIKNDAANPTHSFKDRVVAVAVAKAKELGFETVACASTGNLANAVAAHAAAAGLDSYVFVPADLEEQKLLATGIYGTNLVGIKRQLRRRQPALYRAQAERGPGRSSTSTFAPTTPRARRRSPTRRSSSSAGSSPTASSPRSPRARCSPSSAAGISEWLELGLVEGELPTFCGAQALAALPWPPRSGRAGTSASRSASPRRSRRASRSATRLTAPTRSSWRGRPAASIESVTDDEIREGIRLLAETTGVFTETAGGVTIGCSRQARRGRRDRSGRAGRRVHHRRGAEDARGRPRVVPDARDRAHARCLRRGVPGGWGLA